jgi:hypothetical protein
MRIAPTLVLVFLVLVASARAGDEADPADLAKRFLSADAEERKEAESALAAASPELLRAVLRAVREEARPIEAELPPPEAEAGRRIVTARVWFLDTEVAAAKELFGFEPATDVTTHALDPETARNVFDRVEKADDVTMVTSPTLSMFENQRADVNVINQVSYIQDFEVQVQGDAMIADPVVGTVQEGVVLGMRPVLTPDKKGILVDLDLTVSALHRPMIEHTLKLGAWTARIQLPETRAQGLKTRVAVADRGHVAVRLGAWPQGKEGSVLVAVLQAILDAGGAASASEPVPGK